MNNDGTNCRVGFIGMGFMGHGMAANLLKSGYGLTVMAHHKREAVEDLISRGAVEVNSPADVANASEIVFLCRLCSQRQDNFCIRIKAQVFILHKVQLLSNDDHAAYQGDANRKLKYHQ